jgi:spore coat protein SA
MKRIFIITNGTLPSPSTKGGAVESLLQIFIDLNETSNEFQLVVFSVFDNEAFVLSKAFHSTSFIFIKSETILYKIGRGLRFIVNKFRTGTLKNQFIYEVLKYKKTFTEADLILIENNPRFAAYVREVTNKPLGLHLHNDYLNIEKLDYSKNIIKNLDFVLGVSKYIKNRVSEIAPNECKIDYVYNGINLDRFDDKRTDLEKNTLRKNYSLEKEDIVILFTGRLQESKGVRVLMEAFLELFITYNIKLLIVGSSGFADSKKSDFIKELELLSHKAPNKIIFTGYIKYSEIHVVYGLANFVVLPSLATEAFPLTTIEALASGLPVIVSDAGGMPEGVDASCGFVINRDAQFKQNLITNMELLIVDKQLREKMSIAAKKRAILFSDKHYYDSLSNFLKSVI